MQARKGRDASTTDYQRKMAGGRCVDSEFLVRFGVRSATANCPSPQNCFGFPGGLRLGFHAWQGVRVRHRRRRLYVKVINIRMAGRQARVGQKKNRHFEAK